MTNGLKAVAALAGIVGLERKSHLHDAPAEQDQSDRTDQTENEIAQVVHGGDRVIGSEGRDGAAEHKGNRQYGGAVETEALSDLAGHRQLVCGLFGVLHGFEDILPWIGDSCMLEAVGLGGSAAAAAPAVLRSQGLSWMDGIERTRNAEQITLARHESYLIPALDYQGSPLGIDIRKVLRTGLEPVIHGGMISTTGKRLGAGVAHVPMGCFEAAVLGYGERYGLTDE